MSIPYRRIMAPVDGTDFAEQALPHAQALAEQLGSELVLYRVVQDVADRASKSGLLPEMMGTGMAQGIDEQPYVDEAQEPLDEIAQGLRLHHVDVETVIEVGSPARHIADYANEHDVDLIVMSTHDRSGLDRLMHSSVAQEVLHRARCPVLLVRASSENLMRD